MTNWLWILLGLTAGSVVAVVASIAANRRSPPTRQSMRSLRLGGVKGLLPSRAGASDAPTADDLLGFRRLADPLATRIADVPIADTPWTIGLFGEWGAGKTSFMLMIDESLQRHQIESVWFNAWKYSHEETLWTALLQTVLDRTRIAGPKWRRPIVAFRLWALTLDVRAGTWEVVRKVGGLVLRLALFVLAILFAASALSDISNPANKAAHDLLAGQAWSNGILGQAWARGLLAFVTFLLAGPSALWKAFDPHLRIDYKKFARTKSYAERVAFIDEFSADLQQIVRIAGRGKPLVVMIDDLDRCLPEQVLQIIDAVKMFLDVPGCVFLLAVDRDIIEDAVEFKYAKSTSGPRLQKLRETYAERIIQMPLALPPALPGMVRNFVRELAGSDADIIECAPILIGAPPYNPRRIKRSIQTFALYRDFAPSGDNEPALLPTLLAKLTVIQYQYRELYTAVADDAELLSKLEEAYRSGLQTDEIDKKYAELANKYKLIYPALPELLSLRIVKSDSFVGVLLEPYLSYFRSVAVMPEGDPTAEPQTLITPSDATSNVASIPAPSMIQRTELRNEVASYLDAPPRTGVVSLIALVGAGGFGKTTLSKMITNERQVIRRFNGGIYFVQLGPDIAKVDLAAKVNDLVSIITGSQVGFVDPLLAGQALGKALDTKSKGSFIRRISRVLLIVDDVWSFDQLEPFLIGGRECVRLVTTRRADLVPRTAHVVSVDNMSFNQAAAIISSGVPGISPETMQSLASASGGWPLLSSLINAALRNHVARGQDPAAAAVEVLARLEADGPAALDVSNTFDRTRAVGATINASVNALSDEDAERFYELGVFVEDALIPLSSIEMLWQETGNLTPTQTQILIDRLANLSLISLSTSGEVQIHDLIREYVRMGLGQARIANLERLIERFGKPGE